MSERQAQQTGTVAWSQERFVDVGGGIELCHQTLGDERDQALLLVMGLASQSIDWPDGLCELLAERGFRVIRFDNRDAGRSTWLAGAGVPSLAAAWRGELRDPPYLLSDMAADCAGLLDALGVDAAHVAGASLGGFVAQTLAIEAPERVLSLASIMSSTGSGRVGQPHPHAIEALMSRPPEDRDAYVEWSVRMRDAIGSENLGRDDAEVRAMAARRHARGVNPEGAQRQLVASICSANRTARLGEIPAPAVVLHGTADPLIDVSGGRATAAAISDAQLVLIDGWAHDLPPGVWERVADAIASNAARASGHADA